MAPAGVVGLLALVATLAGPTPTEGEGESTEAEAPEKPEIGTWRFRDDERPIKVVVLAGSVGAWPRRPYGREIERMCSQVEIENISKVGLGAWPLKQHFRRQVLKNRRLDLDSQEQEHWLLFGGGINSIATPEATNHHIKNIFVLAHMAGMKVVGTTVTPWGDDGDRRFRGAGGLEYFEATRKVADFMMGRLSAKEALGSYAKRRPAGVDGPWDPLEVPDIAVDLLDSKLRDRDAAPRDLDAMRRVLQTDRDWQRAHRHLDEQARAQALEADARTLSELPRWYMKPELRSFDHIHPNTEGHRIIATTICPELPENWGCACEPAEPAELMGPPVPSGG